MEIDTIDIQFKQVNRTILKGWIVYYYIDNQLVCYSSDTHNWLDLPKIGVQCLYRIYDTHKELVNGCDFYCPYQLMNVDDIRPWIKFGLYLDDDIFNSQVLPFILDRSLSK